MKNILVPFLFTYLCFISSCEKKDFSLMEGMWVVDEYIVYEKLPEYWAKKYITYYRHCEVVDEQEVCENKEYSGEFIFNDKEMLIAEKGETIETAYHIENNKIKSEYKDFTIEEISSGNMILKHTAKGIKEYYYLIPKNK